MLNGTSESTGLIKIIEERRNGDSCIFPQVIIASLPIFPQDKMMYLFMITRQFGEITYLRLSLINPREEEQVGQEEADAELQVEGGAGALDGSAQQEGEGRQEEAQQREAQPHVGDHSQGSILLLGPSKEEISVTLSCSGVMTLPPFLVFCGGVCATKLGMKAEPVKFEIFMDIVRIFWVSELINSDAEKIEV